VAPTIPRGDGGGGCRALGYMGPTVAHPRPGLRATLPWPRSSDTRRGRTSPSSTRPPADRDGSASRSRHATGGPPRRRDRCGPCRRPAGPELRGARPSTRPGRWPPNWSSRESVDGGPRPASGRRVCRPVPVGRRLPPGAPPVLGVESPHQRAGHRRAEVRRRARRRPWPQRGAEGGAGLPTGTLQKSFSGAGTSRRQGGGSTAGGITPGCRHQTRRALQLGRWWPWARRTPRTSVEGGSGTDAGPAGA
jgi:hypothetical protein